MTHEVSLPKLGFPAEAPKKKRRPSKRASHVQSVMANTP
jgi:hypothetical protein